MFGGFGRGGGPAGRRVRPHVDVGDIFSTIFGRGRGGPGAAARPRPRDRGPAHLRAGDGGHRGPGHRAEAVDLRDLRRQRSEARARRRSSARAARGAASTPRARASSRSASPARNAAAAGRSIENPCPDCRGTGLTMQRKRYRVNVPAGVKDGTRIRLAGKGEDGPLGGPPGDLYVTTRVAAVAGLPPPCRRQPRGRRADHARGGDRRRQHRGPDAARDEADPGRPRNPARDRSSDCAARGRRSRTRAIAATSTTGSRSRSRKDLDRKQREAVDELSRSLDGADARARILRGARRGSAGSSGPDEDRSGDSGKVGAA